jgi:hypothetical protein
VEFEVKLDFDECPACGSRKLIRVALPLDPDAELVRDVFDVRDKTDEEQQEIFGWLRDHGVTADDLEELRRLKGTSFAIGTNPIGEWFARHGLLCRWSPARSRE